MRNQAADAGDVLVVVGVRLYREGIADALRRSGYVLAGLAADEHEALELVREHPPRVAVVDVGGTQRHETVRRLRRQAPRMRIVVVAIRGIAAEVIGWAEAGIAGYLTADDSLERLVDTVGAAARGEAFCTPVVSGALFDHIHRLAASRAVSPTVAALTPREREIAQCLRDGLSNKEIASRLVLALPTVKNHVHHILAKLEVDRRDDAARALSATLI